METTAQKTVTKTITVKELFLKKAIEVAKVKVKNLDDYKPSELNKIMEAFTSDKIQTMKAKFGNEIYLEALNVVFVHNFESEEEDLEESLFD